jgi:class 3 adenylate cyclase/tetratricopeptide (TPR) repeat protein
MRCAACGEAVEAGSRFCRWCGASMAEEGAPRVAAVQDRRFATILFADIVGSTAMVRGLEPEHALERLSPVLEAMKRTVMEYGGTICRDQGDGIMASFGAPRGDDRHASNACLAALALLNRTTAAPVATTCRVGVHSGLVVGHLAATSSGQVYAVSGEAVHLAARLEASARVGTVLVSDATRQLIEGQFVLVERRLKGLKGFGDEIAGFELQRPVGLAWSALRPEPSAMAFCGRDSELARLRRAYEDSASVSVVVSGDPAAGKSRLVREFVAASALSAAVHATACVANLAHTPFAAIRQLLLSLIGQPVDASQEQIELGLLAVLRAAAGGEPAIDEIALRWTMRLPFVDRQWAELEAGARRRRIARATAALLALKAAPKVRNLLVVEDAHWADSASTAVIAEAVRQVGARDFFLLVTTRDLGGPMARSLAGLSPIQMPLGPLTMAACEQILEGLLGRSQSLVRLKGRLLDLGGGTPLFLQQIVRWLVDNRSLVGEPGNYRLAVHADQIEMPGSLRAVVLWRADRLPARTRDVLSIASVIQQGVTGDRIAGLAKIAGAQAQAELELLVDQGLLARAADGADTGFAFRHALLREAVYEAMVEERRIELHALALRQLEDMEPELRLHGDGLMAQHAYASRNWQAVAKYARIVGERAIDSSAYREASTHLEHAVDALYRLPRDRALIETAIDVRLQARACYAAMAQYDLCLAHISRAHELAVEIGDANRILACNTYRAGVLNFTGPVQEAQAIGEEALRQAVATGSAVPIAFAAYVLGQAHYACGSFRDACTAFATGTQGLVGEKALLRLGMAGTAAAMSGALHAAAHAWLGEFDDAALQLARVGDIARRTARPFDAVCHRYALGLTLAMQGEWHDAIDALESALDACRANDIQTFVATIACQLGPAYVQVGRAADAVAYLEPALEEALSFRNLSLVAMLKRQLGFAVLQQGDTARAERLAREAAEAAAGGGYRMTMASSLHLKGLVALQRGGEDVRDGLRAVEQALAIAEALGLEPMLAGLRDVAAELSAAAGGGREGAARSGQRAEGGMS